MKTLVLIPCYNEEANIVRVVERLKSTCPDVDYLVINDQIENSVEQVHAIISCEHFKTARNEDTIDMIQKDLKKFEGR